MVRKAPVDPQVCWVCVAFPSRRGFNLVACGIPDLTCLTHLIPLYKLADRPARRLPCSSLPASPQGPALQARTLLSFRNRLCGGWVGKSLLRMGARRRRLLEAVASAAGSFSGTFLPAAWGSGVPPFPFAARTGRFPRDGPWGGCRPGDARDLAPRCPVPGPVLGCPSAG